MKKKALPVAFMLIVSVVMAGCGDKPEGEPVAAEPVVDEPQGVVLEDVIVLADGWEMADAMSIAEIEALVGVTGYDTWHEPLSDAAAGKPQLSYYDTTRPDGGARNASKINFLV